MKVSVIIATRSDERYMAQCRENIACQSHKDIETIVVEDSAEARNRAIETAAGEWIHFMNAGDLIDLDFYSRMVAAAVETDSDMAFASCRNETEPHLGLEFSERLIVVAPEDKIEVSEVRELGYSWRFIVRRSMLTDGGIRFENGPSDGDSGSAPGSNTGSVPGSEADQDAKYGTESRFSLECVARARCIVTVPETMYFHMNRDGRPGPKTTPERYVYRVFGMPLLRKEVMPYGVARWYLLGVPVAKQTYKREYSHRLRSILEKNWRGGNGHCEPAGTHTRIERNEVF